MTQSAVAFKPDLSSGRERKTDGFWKHLGIGDYGALRVGNNMAPPVGAGVEMLFDRPSAIGYIQSFDRDALAYRDLTISARNISLSPQPGGSLALPPNCIGTAALQDGAVTTPKIAANAVQQLLGYYFGAPTWSVPGNATWTETAVQVSCTTQGGQLRVEFTTAFNHSAANGQWLVGLGLDHVVTVSLQIGQMPTAGVSVSASGCWYTTPAAGAHTLGVFVINYTPGTLTLYNGISSTLYVTEQKR